MHKIKEHIANLKVQLEDIQAQLQPWLDVQAKSEVQSQLNAIAKSTDRLTKTDVNIPSELRQLKLKLINELDNYKQAEDLQQELINVLSAYTTPKKLPKQVNTIKVKNADTIKRPPVQLDLIDLIENGVLPPDTKTIKMHKGVKYTAFITADGKMKIVRGNTEQFYNSPSTAAVACIHKPTNGWTWWSVEGDIKGRTLDYYRQKLINSRK